MPKVKGYSQQREAMQKTIRHRLVANGWNQTHLGELCGYDKSKISKIVNYPDRQSFKTLSKVYKKLGIKEIVII